MSKTATAIADLTARVEALEVKVKEQEQKKIEPEPIKAKGTKTSKKSKEKEEGVEKKKRALSGYNLFCKASRDEAKEMLEEDLEDGEKLKSQDIMKKLAEMWKDLSVDEKDVWNTKAKAKANSDADADADASGDEE